MEALLIWERIILESLSKRAKREQELAEDTSIKRNTLHKVIRGLKQKKIIVQKENKYFLAKEFSNLQAAEEVKDLFSTMVNSYYSGKKSVVKLKKCYFTPEELQIFQAYLYSIEALIENVQKERLTRPIKSKICEQKVIFWAYTQYSNLLEVNS